MTHTVRATRVGSRHLRFLAAGISLLALSACNATWQKSSPQVEKVAALHDASGLDRPVRVAVPFSIDEVGDPSTLEGAVRLTLTTNPAIREAVAGLASASVGPALANTEYAPRLSLAADATLTDNLGKTNFERRFNTGLEFAVTLWDNGAADLRANRERWRALSALAAIGERVELITLSAVEAHMDVLRHRELVAAREDALDAMKKRRGQIAGMKESGIASDADVEHARSRVIDAERRLTDARQMLADAEVRYKRVVGRDADVLKSAPAIPETSAAPESHPSVRILDAEIQAGIVNVLSIDRERAGKLGVNIGPLGVASAIAGMNIFALGTALLALDVPIYDGGERELRLRRAISAVDVAMGRRGDVLRVVDAAVQQARNAKEAALKNEKTARDKRKSSERLKSTTMKDYEIGMRSVREVLDSEVERGQAIADEITARYAAQFADYRIAAARGVLAETIKAVKWTERPVDGISDPFEGLLESSADAASAPMPVQSPPVSTAPAATGKSAKAKETPKATPMAATAAPSVPPPVQTAEPVVVAPAPVAPAPVAPAPVAPVPVAVPAPAASTPMAPALAAGGRPVPLSPASRAAIDVVPAPIETGTAGYAPVPNQDLRWYKGKRLPPVIEPVR